MKGPLAVALWRYSSCGRDDTGDLRAASAGRTRISPLLSLSNSGVILNYDIRSVFVPMVIPSGADDFLQGERGNR